MKKIHPELQKHINRNNSPTGMAAFLKAARESAELLTRDELRAVISDVNEYSGTL